MAKDRDEALDWLQNHLMAEDDRQEQSARVYNADTADVDLDRFSEAVCERPKKRSCVGLVILLLLLALGAFLYLVWGGKLPWN